MKITLSVNGRYHAFDLANQLQKLGHLNRLITSYPSFYAEKWGIQKDKVISILPIEIMKRITQKNPLIPTITKHWFYLKYQHLFDEIASHYISKESDIFIGWSGSSFKCIKRAKRLNIKTILERGSSHILTQKKILQEEYHKNNLLFHGLNDQTVKQELKEYETVDYIEIPSTFAYKSFISNGVSKSKLIQGFRGIDLSSFKTGKTE